MMTADIALSPNHEAMLQALEHAFGDWLDGLHDGLIEITYVENQGAGKPTERWIGAMFGTDDIEAAAEYAAEVNRAGHNVYFAPALRKPGTRRDRRASKPDVLGTTMLWAEWDDADAFNSAMEKVQFCKPTMGCVTGSVPAKRAQAMWRLKEPITDPDEIDAALRGMATVLGGDPKVVHADCLMRLPGSISWRKLNKPERVDEITTLRIGFSDRPSIYPTGQVLKAYPPIAATERSAGFEHADYKYTRGPLGLQGELADGREMYMHNTLCAVLVEFIGTNGAAPTAEELMEAAWPQYSSKVNFSRPGRDAKEMHDKCIATVQRFHAGRIRGARTLEEAAASWKRKQERLEQERQARQQATTVKSLPSPSAGTTASNNDVAVGAEAEDGIRLLDLAQVLKIRPPSWLIKNWLVRDGLIMVYGPPASLKSFLVLDWLLHVAYGRDWHGDKTEGGGALYVAGEGLGGLPKRLQAWLQHTGVAPDGPFFTIGQTVNMLDAREVEAVAAAVKAKAAAIGKPFVIVALDTVARTMVGGEENSALDMGKYVHHGDWLKREIGCALILVHHAGKDATRGARGSSALLGAVDTSILVERDKESGVVTLTMEKQKDAEEPPEVRLTPRKIDLAGHIEPVTSLVLVPEELPEQAAKADPVTPDRVRQILNIIQSAWDAGDPFSEAMNSPRFVVSMMTRQFRMARGAALDLLGHWRDNGMVVSERRSRDTATRGLRVAKWPGDRL